MLPSSLTVVATDTCNMHKKYHDTHASTWELPSATQTTPCSETVSNTRQSRIDTCINSATSKTCKVCTAASGNAPWASPPPESLPAWHLSCQGAPLARYPQCSAHLAAGRGTHSKCVGVGFSSTCHPATPQQGAKNPCCMPYNKCKRRCMLLSCIILLATPLAF